MTVFCSLRPAPDRSQPDPPKRCGSQAFPRVRRTRDRRPRPEGRRQSFGGYDLPFEQAVAEGCATSAGPSCTQIGVSRFRIDLGVVNPIAPATFCAGSSATAQHTIAPRPRATATRSGRRSLAARLGPRAGLVDRLVDRQAGRPGPPGCGTAGVSPCQARGGHGCEGPRRPGRRAGPFVPGRRSDEFPGGWSRRLPADFVRG